MKGNIGKYIELNFWPKIPKSKNKTNLNNYGYVLNPQEEVSFSHKLSSFFKQNDITRKGILALNIIAIVKSWSFLPLILVGSAAYLYFQAKRIKSAPALIYNGIKGNNVQHVNTQPKTNVREFNYDPSTININDLQIGFLIDYNLMTYQVVEHYQLTSTSHEEEEKLVLLSGINEVVIFKNFNTPNLKIRVLQKVNVYSISENLDTEILLKQKPNPILTFKGKKFYRDENLIGSIYSFNEKKSLGRYAKWDYFDESREEYLCIEQMGSKTFGGYYGKIVHETSFSDILPKK